MWSGSTNSPRVRTRRPPAGWSRSRRLLATARPIPRRHQRSVVVHFGDGLAGDHDSAVARGSGRSSLCGKRTVPGRGRHRSGRWNQHERRWCGRSTVLRQCRQYREREDLEVSGFIKLGDRGQGDGGTADRWRGTVGPDRLPRRWSTPAATGPCSARSSPQPAAPCWSSAGFRLIGVHGCLRNEGGWRASTTLAPPAVRTVCANAAFMLPGNTKSDAVRRGGERRHIG
jgi:hypothetical protein